MRDGSEWRDLFQEVSKYVRDNKYSVTIPKDYFESFMLNLYKTLTSQKKEDFLDMQELRIKQVDSLIGIINADSKESNSNFNQRAQDVVIKKLGEILDKMK